MEGQYYKKIRILSFQNAHNFGAILQAYGLQQTLISLGYKDVKFINYNPKYLRDRYNPFSKFNTRIPKTRIKGKIYWIVNYIVYVFSTISRNRIFNSSIRLLLKQTKKRINNINDLSALEVDILICGSDQIWNTSLTGEFDCVFLAQGNYKRRGYAFSYAPSTELSSLTDERAKELSEYLNSFKYLSVRENPIKEILEKYIKKNISVCLDPTLLCGATSFINIASDRKCSKDYILVYAYNPYDNAISKLIESIPNNDRYSIQIILLGSKDLSTVMRKNIHSSISVVDFLSYFKYASYVVANSFHGLAFSLLFKKNFNISLCEGKHVRCLSLLKDLKMESRFICYDKNVSWDEIDYSMVSERLSALRKDSLNFLNKALEK